MDKNLKTRLVVGLFGIVVILFATVVHLYSFVVVFFFFWSLSTLELIHLIDSEGMYRLFMLLFSLWIGLLYPGYGVVIPYELILLIWVLAVFFIFTSNFASVRVPFFVQNHGSWMKSLTFPVYVTLPYIFLVIIRSGERGLFWIVFLLLTAWILDVFSYFAGMLFGKHKIAPKISPKKTVEGLLGGILFSSVFIFMYLKYFTNTQLIPILFIAFTLPVAGFLGDLFESLIKRREGVKDSGDLLSGHGGFLDRFDSILFITILFSFYHFILRWL